MPIKCLKIVPAVHHFVWWYTKQGLKIATNIFPPLSFNLRELLSWNSLDNELQLPTQLKSAVQHRAYSSAFFITGNRPVSGFAFHWSVHWPSCIPFSSVWSILMGQYSHWEELIKKWTKNSRLIKHFSNRCLHSVAGKLAEICNLNWQWEFLSVRHI